MDAALLWVASLALVAGFAALTAVIAQEKGHSPLTYALLGMCFPLVGLIVALMQPDRSARPANTAAVAAPIQLLGQGDDAAEGARG